MPLGAPIQTLRAEKVPDRPCYDLAIFGLLVLELRLTSGIFLNDVQAPGDRIVNIGQSGIPGFTLGDASGNVEAFRDVHAILLPDSDVETILGKYVC
jgi:hypothetical protein